VVVTGRADGKYITEKHAKLSVRWTKILKILKEMYVPS